MSTKLIVGDVRQALKQLPAESVHCVVTSPPYWGLRDYGTASWDGGDPECDHKVGRFERGGLSAKQASNNGSAGDEARHDCPKCGATRIDNQLGLEPTPEQYVENMVAVFREVRRVLRNDGTLWLNLGDSYAASSASLGRNDQDRNRNDPRYREETRRSLVGVPRQGSSPRTLAGLKPKDLVGIPWRVAFALQADGWYLRSDIIWSKPNPMPESVTDRPTKSHEYVFLLSKQARYYYDADAIKEPTADYDRKGGTAPWTAESGHTNGIGSRTMHQMSKSGRNKRDVWTIPTKPFKGAHFAVFPPALIEPCILAGTSEGGVCAECGAPLKRLVERNVPTDPGRSDDAKLVGGEGLSARAASTAKRQLGQAYQDQLDANPPRTVGWQPSCAHDAGIAPAVVMDIFGGSGTTAMVAKQHGRNAVLIELNAEYVPLIKQRLSTPEKKVKVPREKKAVMVL